MTRPIFNIADAKLQSVRDLVPGAPAGFDGWMGEIGEHVGAQKLGYNLTVVPPGARAWPRHNHRVNEEMFFVIDGEGEVRIGASTYPIRGGDVIACPPGGTDTAHQIVNTGTRPLRYLAVSTELTPEIVDYPDSGKFSVRAEFGSEGTNEARTFRFRGRAETSLPYWEGE